jgi:hypothetical protein
LKKQFSLKPVRVSPHSPPKSCLYLHKTQTQE